ncbi:MAG: bifunctional diguanylate cyclase/phosphodiesterase, partial [Calditerrivibrio sp.]|nr:bifunctional diguanylate cyclase/phosphodiesterase [Calditerrivibrio sp.]
MKIKTHFSTFIFLLVISVSLLTFFSSVMIFYYIEKKNSESVAYKELYQYSKMIEDIETFYFNNINLGKHHIKLVENLTGGEFVKEIQKDNLVIRDGDYYIFIEKRYKKHCISCHSDKKINEIAGSFAINLKMKYIFENTKKYLLIFFVILSPIPILGTLFIAYIFSRRVKAVKNNLIKSIKGINSIKDLSKLSTVETEQNFKEFDDIFSGLNEFISKTRDLAIDKDILKFEITLLEKFLITSDVIKDWRKYILSIVGEMNKFISIQFVFSLFRVNDTDFSLELFWTVHPSEELKKHIENLIEVRCKEFYSSHCEFKSISVNHSFLSSEICDILNPTNLDLKTKNLIIDEPKIGGIVGVGINLKDTSDNIKSLVIEGILTTLLNVIGSVKAISKYNKELEYFSTRDHITNLFNQRVFWDLLKYEVARSRRNNYKFAVMIVDIDNFKFINDNFGHDVGDNLLIDIAKIIRQSVRLGDIISRHSSDEFAIIMPEIDNKDAFTVASKLIEDIGNFEFKHNSEVIRITASIGFGIFPDHAKDEKGLFAFADTMLYKAKSEGKNKVLKPSKEDIQQANLFISEISFKIKKAMDENRIIPYFQPILNIKNSNIEYYEVLSRINMDGQIISAYEFIEITEKTGMVTQIDYIIMEKTFDILKKNSDKAFFINLSPKSLIISEFIPKIIELTKKYNVKAENIVFEITERETVRNLSILEKFIINLRSEGYKFAIDDFGSGFSSYEYIKRFPVDFVKIDGEFIKNILRSSKDLAIVKSLLILTKEFNIKTVAEFVENQEIYDKIKELG